MLYALRAIVKTALFSQESAIKSRHCLLASLYKSWPVRVDKSTPVDVSNIELPESPQISPKSDVKSTVNSPSEVPDELDDEDDELFPDNKSLISDNIFAAALVSRLIAFSPSVAVYIAVTSSAVRLTAVRLLSWNCANRFNAWSIAFSVSRNSSYRALHTHLRYVSFAFAQN